MYPTAWLPNRHGFAFTAHLRGGATVRCRVVKGANFADVLGWDA